MSIPGISPEELRYRELRGMVITLIDRVNILTAQVNELIHPVQTINYGVAGPWNLANSIPANGPEGMYPSREELEIYRRNWGNYTPIEGTPIEQTVTGWDDDGNS